MSTYAGRDDATNLLLDFIAGGVPGNPGGESAGNYNAVIGNAKATDDLSQKTLAEIYALQDQLRASGQPSTAIGRYQFIKSTLSGLQERLKLPDDTKFTNELQDRLAVELLVGRGYSGWWRGSVSDSEFAHNISLEWASLPDPDNGGKSHYDGVGPNHAGTSLESVYGMLKDVRGLRGAAQPAPAAPQPAAPALAPASDDTSADELNRRELEQIKASLPTPAPASAPPVPRMAPGVAITTGAAGGAAFTPALQFLWPLLHLPIQAPTDMQSQSLSALFLAVGGGVGHMWYSYQQRKGNR